MFSENDNRVLFVCCWKFVIRYLPLRFMVTYEEWKTYKQWLCISPLYFFQYICLLFRLSNQVWTLLLVLYFLYWLSKQVFTLIRFSTIHITTSNTSCYRLHFRLHTFLPLPKNITLRIQFRIALTDVGRPCSDYGDIQMHLSVWFRKAILSIILCFMTNVLVSTRKRPFIQFVIKITQRPVGFIPVFKNNNFSETNNKRKGYP